MLYIVITEKKNSSRIEEYEAIKEGGTKKYSVYGEIGKKENGEAWAPEKEKRKACNLETEEVIAIKESQKQRKEKVKKQEITESGTVQKKKEKVQA